MRKKVSAVVLGAGSGERFGSQDVPKQYVEIGGTPLFRITLDKFVNHSLVSEIIYVYNDDHEKFLTQKQGIFCVTGGQTRQDSVRRGLERATGEYVIIHDAVRPGVSAQHITQIVEALDAHESVSHITGSRNTIVRTKDGDWQTVGKFGLYELLLPQAFDRGKLLTAHYKTGLVNCPSDTIIYEETWRVPFFALPGDIRLFKLTYKEDLKIVEALCGH